jgi:hypothetical protein
MFASTALPTANIMTGAVIVVNDLTQYRWWNGTSWIINPTGNVRVGSVIDSTTSAAALTLTESIKLSLTVSLVNGRKYRIGAYCALNMAGTAFGSSNYILVNVRYASGGTVTSSGTEVCNIELPQPTAALNVTKSALTEKTWSASSGTYTFGLGAVAGTLSPACLYGGGASQPSYLYVDDVT